MGGTGWLRELGLAAAKQPSSPISAPQPTWPVTPCDLKVTQLPNGASGLGQGFVRPHAPRFKHLSCFTRLWSLVKRNAELRRDVGKFGENFAKHRVTTRESRATFPDIIDTRPTRLGLPRSREI